MRNIAIGNYLEYAGVLVEVLGIKQNGFIETNGVEAPYTSFVCIKITDDLLSDIGYVKNKNHFHLKLHCIWKCNDIYLCDKNGTVLTYLHQLQNLLWFTKGIKINYPSKHYILDD